MKNLNKAESSFMMESRHFERKTRIENCQKKCAKSSNLAVIILLKLLFMRNRQSII